MMGNWKAFHLVVEAAILATIAAIFYGFERHALRRVTNADARKWTPERLAALAQSLQELKVSTRPLTVMTPLALGSLLLVAIIKPTLWIPILGIGVAIVFGNLVFHSYMQFLQAVQARIQSVLRENAKG